MPTTPDRRKLRHTVIVAPTEDNHHAPKPPSCRVPRTTFKKECNDDDAAARTSPRISPGTRRVEGGEVHPTPFKKDGGAHRRHRIGAGKTRHGFLPTSRAHHPGPTFGSTTPTAHQHAPTITNNHQDTAVVSPRPTKRGRPDPNETPEDKDRQHRSHEGGNNLHRLRR